MATDKPIKCASKGFKAAPFFLIQSNGAEKRFVVSFQNADNIKSFLLNFIENSKQDLQIKICDFDDRENPEYFSGEITKSKLINILENYSDLVFHDGYHDLMIRKPETGDYVAFDEHGLIFIYTQQNYSDMLIGLNLKYKPNEKLIYEFEHWHYRSESGREDLKKLISELGLH